MVERLERWIDASTTRSTCRRASSFPVRRRRRAPSTSPARSRGTPNAASFRSRRPSHPGTTTSCGTSTVSPTYYSSSPATRTGTCRSRSRPERCAAKRNRGQHWTPFALSLSKGRSTVHGSTSSPRTDPIDALDAHYAAGGSYDTLSHGVSMRTPPRYRESMRAACAPVVSRLRSTGYCG